MKKNGIFKTCAIVLLLVCGSYLGFRVTKLEPSSKDFIVVGSGGISGVYFRIAGKLCTLVNSSQELGNVDCSVQATPGSLYNINSLHNGSTDIIFTQDDWEYKAYRGVGGFSEPIKDLRMLARLYQEPLTIIARKDSNIKVIDDIVGKRINVGAPGSGVSGAMTTIFQLKGWDKSHFKLTTKLRDSEQSQALCDNKIDAMVTVMGHPNGAVQEALATCEITFVHLDHDLIQGLSNEQSCYAPYRIPKGTYEMLHEDINTVAVRTDILVSKNLDYTQAYNLARLLVDNFDVFRSIHNVMGTIDKKDLVQPGFVPMHDGAKAFYREVGFIK